MTVLEFKKKIKNVSQIDKSNYIAPPANTTAIGIDLGTTNSVVSIFSGEDEKPTTLFYEGSNLIPSLLYYDAENDKIIVGLKAKKFNDKDSSHVIKSTKRSMGKNHPPFCSHNKTFSAEEVATAILQYILSHPTIVEEKEKQGGLWAVITVPAHFDDAARTATILSAEKAGITVLRIINEPTAAALAYSVLDETDKNNSENLAIFDFGGGTFDVSIVERNDLTFNVLSSEGDVNLGGDDIDEVLAQFFLKKVEPPFIARRAEKDSELYRKISLHAQDAKKALQTALSVTIEDQNLDGKGSSLKVTLDRNEFEEMIFSILQKALFLTERSIQSAKKSPKNISRILLVGGSTRLNLIRKMLTDYFPCVVDARLEPDIAVSWGACIQAAIILGIEIETILVDVCTHTLGVGVVESSDAAQDNVKQIAKKYGLSYPLSESELKSKFGDKIDDFNLEVQGLLRVAPILYRNSPLPARKSEFFNTVYHNQGAVHVVVVQGEGDIVNENRLIGSFMFQLVQPTPKGTRCEIQLTYDVNGMVQVFAKQLGTDNEYRAHFDSRTGQVQGWSKVETSPIPTSLSEPKITLESSNVTVLPKVTKMNKNLEVSEDLDNHKVVSISFGSKKKDVINESSDLNSISVVNAIILRAKRVLSKMDLNSPEYDKIFTLTKQYAQLIERSHEENCEDEVEIIEDELLLCLEGK